MKLGRITGTVVSTVKYEKYVGMRRKLFFLPLPGIYAGIIAKIRLHAIGRFRLKSVYLPLPVHQQRQRRRLHPPNAQQRLVFYGTGAGQVHARRSILPPRPPRGLASRCATRCLRIFKAFPMRIWTVWARPPSLRG